ncbi:MULTISPECIES: malate synthase A [Emticicia]|uniref:malate synthase A n=1 Tax=Emticicia TaxID=312278 RepID=UPI0007D8B050|nr:MULTISPECIES: malate synthase A [Emticicia]
MRTNTDTSVDILGEVKPAYETILTPEAIDFIIGLHKRFNWRREDLLTQRQERQHRIDAGEMPNFLESTKQIRESEWQINPIPQDLQNRRVEITGPVDRRMIINALNSGAKVFMADFEDANSPTWDNCIEGQLNLRAAIRREIDFIAENGRTYSLNEKTAVLKVRPRGWHLLEKHLEVEGEPISASIFDFGLYFFHNAKQLIENGSGPYFYLPKLESHLEARLWDDIFVAAQETLGIPIGTIKVTVLIETILAAFEMDEIIYELRRHLAGLNAGRWDYIFSVIKKFRNHAEFILPDRADVTMRVPFMRAYTQLLVKTCHRRGAHAIGGMAAFIPNRRDEKVNTLAFERVTADKELEVNNGFDGTWVAHPDLVPVAMEAFNKKLGEKSHQKEILREDVRVTADDLLDVRIDNATITENGLRTNINVGILYIDSWLRGIGAAAIHNLMEDAATAEISRAQIWQWLKHRVKTQEGDIIEPNYYHQLLVEEVEKIKKLAENGQIPEGKYKKSAELFNTLVMKRQFSEFLTLGAYKELE